MPDEDFIRLLAASRIPKGTGDLRHYLKARRWAETLASGPKDYERLIAAAARYVGI